MCETRKHRAQRRELNTHIVRLCKLLRFLEREVAGAKQVQFCIGQVTQLSPGPAIVKKGSSLPGTMSVLGWFFCDRLPLRIQREVCLIVEQELGLNGVLAWPAASIRAFQSRETIMRPGRNRPSVRA